MIRERKTILKIAVSILIIMLFVMPLSALAYSSDDDSIVLVSGEDSFTIEVELDNIEELFASAQFDVTVSDGTELQAVDISFDIDGGVSTISTGGKANGNEIVYLTGFFSIENQYSGKIKVGTITFNYEGDTAQTITLDNLEVFRLTGAIKDGLPETVKTAEEWSRTITVSRDDSVQKVQAPKANPVPGKYASKTEIVLTSKTEGAKIYYTLDGSNPAKSSSVYSKPIILDKDMTIKAFAVKEGYIDSSIATFTYTVSSGGSGGSGTGNGSGSGGGEPAVPEQPEPVVFEDVNSGDWFHDAVQYVYAKGLMMGTSTDPMLFSPNATTTRGMVVTILYRMEGSPAVAQANPFSDVAADQYYAAPVIWASNNNIVSGYGNGLFGPNDPITREQMALILMNYAKFKGYDVSAKANLTTFNDYSTVSPWALDAISWANAKGLIQGSNNNLMPGGNAERCQVAAILQRFIEMD